MAIKAILVITYLILSCAKLSLAQDKFTLTVAMGERQSHGKIFLFYKKDGQYLKDSAELLNGKSEFRGILTEPVLASLSFSPSIPTERFRNSFSFYLESGDIKVNTSNLLKTAKVTGSISAAAYLFLSQKTDSIQQEKLAVLEKLKSGQSRNQDKIQTTNVVKRTDSALAVAYRNFATSHPSSLISIFAINKLTEYEVNLSEIRPIFNQLTTDIKKSPSGKLLAQKIATAEKTEVGRTLEDFSLPDTTGVNLSSISLRGKFVLIDFWASWCIPCRKENPALVTAFDHYKDRGFTILSVSFDSKKSNWTQAITADRMTWAHVSDLLGWKGKVGILFGIRSLPQNLLVDPNGKILARNLNGEQLEKILKKLLDTFD